MREAFEKKAAKAKLFGVCLRETRARTTGVSVLGRYVAAAAKGNGKNYGCEVWLSTVILVYTSASGSYYVKSHCVSIAHEEHRILAVAVHVSILKFIIMSCHALYGNNDAAVKWWDHLLHIYRSLLDFSSNVFLAIDANIAFRIPSGFSSTLGPAAVGHRGKLHTKLTTNLVMNLISSFTVPLISIVTSLLLIILALMLISMRLYLLLMTILQVLPR